ncbi:Fis family transcriptional regulator [Spirochaetia bacterium]|nr:Fis family transcriptional regulator [Spirochaetia bacterium]
MPINKKKIIFGFLGTLKDRLDSEYQPTLSVCTNRDLAIDEFHLFYGNTNGEFEILAEAVRKKIMRSVPGLQVILHSILYDKPWDFEEVYPTLFKECEKFKFDTAKNEYYFHISTGTHAVKISIFLLAATGYFPGKLIQSFRPNKEAGRPAEQKVIDLSLGQYSKIKEIFIAKNNDDALKLTEIKTKNKELEKIVAEITEVAINDSDPILLLGRTGTGKTYMARVIHKLRKEHQNLAGSMVEVNCAVLTKELAASELFGYEKGAFTGADEQTDGYLKEADKGILFLDEIGELGLNEQAMLLKAIEDKKFRRVGHRPGPGKRDSRNNQKNVNPEVESDFQLICGTNRDLYAEVKAGRFREDLLTRIDRWTYTLPALKDRREDLAEIISRELGLAGNNKRPTPVKYNFNKTAHKKYLEFAMSPDTPWKGNYRDIKNSIGRMCALSGSNGNLIDENNVNREIDRLKRKWGASEPRGTGDHLLTEFDEIDRIQLREVIKICQASKNRTEAGKKLFNGPGRGAETPNYSDRIVKYLERFGMDFDEVKEGDNSD